MKCHQMRKALFAASVLLVLVILLSSSGCGETTTYSFGNRKVGLAQINGITLTKIGNTWKLKCDAKTKKDGRITFTFNVEKDKGKTKVAIVKDISAGSSNNIEENTNLKGKLRDCKISSVDFQPFEVTSKDYPTETGVQYIYYSGKQTSPYEYPEPFPVNFNITGPWDFSQGPTEGQLVTDTLVPKEAREFADFPDANKVIKNSYASSSDTRFYKVDEGSVQLLGRSTSTLLTEVPYIYKFSPPEQIYKFPFKVGDTWESSGELTFSGAYSGKGSYSITNKVIAKNAVIVPQGEYDICYLIQNKAQVVDIDGSTWSGVNYNWFVPNIGSVASVSSTNGEQNEVYTQGTEFLRLKFKGAKQPGL